MTRRRFPEVRAGDLRPYLPALRVAVRLARERERRLRERFEPEALRLVTRTRSDLEDLLHTVEEL